MKRIEYLDPSFVDEMPAIKQEGILYISIGNAVAIHLCACGCGEEVVTPLDQPEWQQDGWDMKVDLTAKTLNPVVTLRPSIGNFNFPCRSHYYITKNKIEWLI